MRKKIFYYAVWSRTLKGFSTRLSKDSHPGKENSKRAAFSTAWHPCASTPGMRNTAKKILIVDKMTLVVASSVHLNLIMMDLSLPGMNGDEAKRNASTPHIPVVNLLDYYVQR